MVLKVTLNLTNFGQFREPRWLKTPWVPKTGAEWVPISILFYIVE